MNKKLIDDISKRIGLKFKPKKIVLFGSTALGKETKNSDIDLCIIKDAIQDKSKEYIEIRKMLDDILVPMDIIFFNNKEYNKRKDIFGTVQYEIDKKGVVIYESGN